MAIFKRTKKSIVRAM